MNANPTRKPMCKSASGDKWLADLTVHERRLGNKSRSVELCCKDFPTWRVTGKPESAGINRHVVRDERALQERKAVNPSWPRDRKQRGEGKPETFTFLGFTHFCGQRKRNGAFIVWRITAKKRMVAKLKAIKAELRRRLRIHQTP